MIEFKKGNMFEADVQLMVNTVNTLGVMGKGIALQFKRLFQSSSQAYIHKAKKGKMKAGDVFVTPSEKLGNPEYIAHLATKDHWRKPSKIEFVRDGLINLKREIKKREIKSIALPPLGCGNGGLAWAEVKPLIEEILGELDNVHMIVYPPQTDFSPNAPVSNEKPKLTVTRAALLALMDRYKEELYELTLLEIQKLAYFLQEAGEPMKLNYEKHLYGPYANNLNHLVHKLEGHYLSGYKGETGPNVEITLFEKSGFEAAEFLKQYRETSQRLNRVSELIEGYEWPYGMELLSTVHWTTTKSDGAPLSLDEVIQTTKNWSPRKKDKFEDYHIQKAWQSLNEKGWLTPGPMIPVPDHH